MLRAAFIALGMILAMPCAAAPLAGISYSPSGVVAFPDLEKEITEDHIRADLTQIKSLTDEVRIYTMAFGLDRVVPVAAAMGMKVTVGVYLGRDLAHNAAEIAQAIALVKAYPKTVTRVIVGDETVQRGDLTAEQVIRAMADMRRGVGPVAVGTAEIWSVWQNQPALVAASDFVGAHIIPYWDGVTVDEAPAYVQRRIDELQRAYPNKPILVAETGWPSSGPVRQGAQPSFANQAQFARAFAAAAKGRAFFLDEAYDQPWKAAREGDEPLWGLFDTSRKPKPVVELLRAGVRARD